MAPTSGPPWTEREAKRALYFAYHERYAVLTEVCAYDAEQRRIDVLLYSRKERRAIEIKVSRADLLSDVSHPEKQQPWREITHRHYYAVPEPLLEYALGTVPLSSGIIVITRQQGGMFGVQVKRPSRALNREPRDLPEQTMAAMFFRLSTLEANSKGLSWGAASVDGVGSSSDPELQERIKRLERDLEIERRKFSTKAGEAAEWKRRFAHHEPLSCAWCSAPIVPVTRAPAARKGSVAAEWRHKDETANGVCSRIRVEGLRARVAAGDVGEHVLSQLGDPEGAARVLEPVGPR